MLWSSIVWLSFFFILGNKINDWLFLLFVIITQLIIYIKITKDENVHKRFLTYIAFSFISTGVTMILAYLFEFILGLVITSSTEVLTPASILGEIIR